MTSAPVPGGAVQFRSLGFQGLRFWDCELLGLRYGILGFGVSVFLGFGLQGSKRLGFGFWDGRRGDPK